ncbi:MAG: hypothetical protein HQM09_17870, partial [Candidatus Riflebacteria bacterium]|nr:hypothetical protein [Candidatus Riflebacteria bacterium]
MKIMFIGGDLFGDGGVADYAKLLSEAVQELGHKTFILSLFRHDNADSAPPFTPCSTDFLNISETATWNERIKSGRDAIRRFKPDVISMQFVPFSYQKKGILHGEVGKNISELLSHIPLHIFFHELHAGLRPSLTCGYFWLGLFQRMFFKRFILKLNPMLLHTNSSIYIYYTKKMGLNVKKLDLFGNIKVEKPDRNVIFKLFADRNIPIDSQTRNSFILMGFFGGIQNLAPIELFLQQLKSVKD